MALIESRDESMDVRLPEPTPIADYLFTNYFLNEVLRKRPYIKPEWCVFVIENAVHSVISKGLRTGDIHTPGTTLVGTSAMGDAIAGAI